jgi:dCTP diphosphatase
LEKYHNPKDLAISISIESNELLELFQWKNLDEIQKLLENPDYLKRIKNELADVIIYCLSFVDVLGIDVSQAVIEKKLRGMKLSICRKVQRKLLQTIGKII